MRRKADKGHNQRQLEAMMIINVELREKIDPFDFRSWAVQLPCGDGNQRLCWLAYAACMRMALTTGGPKAFTGYSDPISFRDFSSVTSGSITFDVVDAHIDMDGLKGTNESTRGTTKCLDAIDWPSYGLDKQIDYIKEHLSPFVGAMQSLIIWYSSIGEELEDKDFGVLNIEQFCQVFMDAEIVNENLSVLNLEIIFETILEKRKQCAQYQFSAIEFFPALFNVASVLLYGRKTISEGILDVCEKVVEIMNNHLIPHLSAALGPWLKDLQMAAQKPSVEILRDMNETFVACLKVCNSEEFESDRKVSFQSLLPFLKRWAVLGDEWDSRKAAALVIFSYQGEITDAAQFIEIPLKFQFEVKDLQEFFLGASFLNHRESKSLIKISEQAYLKNYLKELFTRASVMKPLYHSYEEKKEYLRSILLKKDNS